MVEKGIGLALGSRYLYTDEEIVKLAQRVEALGYSAIFAGESWARDPFTVLTMIACHTRRIHVGTGIVTVYSRSPAALAMTAASLDSISRGRVILGLGTSGPVVIEGWHGIPYGKPLRRTREYIDIIRLALSGGRVNYQGEYFKVQRFQMAFVGPSKERVPIWLAAIGQRNLALTGELCDGWYPAYLDLQHLPAMWEQVAEGARRAGRDPQAITVAPSVMTCVTPSVEEARKLMRGHLAYYLGGMGTYYSDLMARYGFVEEMARIREAWAKGEREKAASAVTEEILDRITISGDESTARRLLQRYYDAGAHMPVLTFPHGATWEMIYGTLEALAPRA
ncbi:MAG: LLM class flavin-dependent oxidoreductase [Chloroflexi bacterium]|nr:LLM class flavin-dependent oxidoreductase [Chloroflexota bacterium]